MTTRPSMTDALRRVARAHVAEVYTSVAAEVLAYDRTDQTVRVRVKVASPYQDADGDDAWSEVPDIGGVPVLFLRMGGVTLTAGIDVGDVGLLLIRDRSHDEVDSGSGEAGQVTPASGRRWDYSDAAYLPAQLVPADPIPSSGHRADGAAVLALPGGLALHVGSSTASTAVARADRCGTNFGDIAATIGPIITAWNTIAGMGGGPLVVGSAVPVYAPTATASTRLLTDD